MPKISVIMPVYNTEAFIAQSIESILVQSFNDFEFIIIDDCSSDSSYDICQKYSQNDNRIKLFKNEFNIGVVKTRNKLLEKVSSDSIYIAIIDSDDVAYPDRLKEQYQYLEMNSECSIVGSNLDIIDENNNIIGYRKYPMSYNDIKNSISKKSPLAQPAVMVRKSDRDNIGNYNINFERSQDYELWFRFFDQGYGIVNIQKPLLKYRVFGKQGKSRHLKLTLKNTIKIQKKYIFTKKYFTISSFVYLVLEHFLLLIPNNLVLRLFKLLEYKKYD